MRLQMKYDIPHFDQMDEYMLRIIKMMDIYVKKDDLMLIYIIQCIIDNVACLRKFYM